MEINGNRRVLAGNIYIDRRIWLETLEASLTLCDGFSFGWILIGSPDDQCKGVLASQPLCATPTFRQSIRRANVCYDIATLAWQVQVESVVFWNSDHQKRRVEIPLIWNQSRPLRQISKLKCLRVKCCWVSRTRVLRITLTTFGSPYLI